MIRNFTIITVVLLCVAAFLIWSLLNWAKTPIVQFSTATGRCVNVIDWEDRYTCGQPPKKYIKEWVK